MEFRILGKELQVTSGTVSTVRGLGKILFLIRASEINMV